MYEIKLSPEFKSQTKKSIFSIVFFILTYLILLILAVGLTALCVFGGIMIVMTFPRILGIVLGIGLASIGFLVLFFLLKFIFKSHKVDRSHLQEIKRKDEPELFNMLDAIVQQVGTTFPKKVYLSADVNAAVFYDSNFWSMFLPVRKNLQIGLGLVNTVTDIELKAILAHEFGHFSQRTMKVGSYVYNVNQVIYNLLYDNESYDNVIQSWAEVSSYFSIFVVIAVRIIEGIQAILRKMYEVVNRNYMALSREMEFHADEIAASVTGYKPLKSSLLRIKLADHAHQSVLNFYGEKVKENFRSGNMFQEQFHVMNFLATEDNILLENQLPMVSLNDLNRFNKSRLVIKDQWASHPSTKERIERLEQTGLTAEKEVHQPAGSIFQNIENTYRHQTAKLFESVQYQGESKEMTLEEFQDAYKAYYEANTFSRFYNGYYDDKQPIRFDLKAAAVEEETTATAETLFSNQQIELVYTAFSLQNDIETLKQLAGSGHAIKTFDYDGKKYASRESAGLASKLAEELKELNEQIKQNDIRIFQFFLKREQELGESLQLKAMYQTFFDYDTQIDAKSGLYTEMLEALQFINYNLPFEQIRENFANLAPKEAILKHEIKELMESERYQQEITPEMQENFEQYLSKKWEYFGHENYFERPLEMLFKVLNNYGYLLSRGYFLMKKELLNYQEELVKRQETLGITG
ncbi:M48 family metalloprotease [Limibacter armeniacum]|uniref:M48 family metalloprotease n=1 Tax=Limibacter armeniacum TaxID=466084 RepID=UPI002FE63F02